MSRTKNQEPRTKNQEPRTKNQEPRIITSTHHHIITSPYQTNEIHSNI